MLRQLKFIPSTPFLNFMKILFLTDICIVSLDTSCQEYVWIEA